MKALEEASKTASGFFTFGVAANLFLQFFMKFSMKLMWRMMAILNLIVNLPFFNINLTGNVIICFDALLSISSFSLID